MGTFKFTDSPYGYKMFNTNTAKLKPGITILTGPSEYGKTTFLRLLKEVLDSKFIPCLSIDVDNIYDYIIEDILNDPDGCGAKFFQMSNGCQRYTVIDRIFEDKIKNFLGDAIQNFPVDSTKRQQIFILLENVDSGLDITLIESVKYWLDIIVGIPELSKLFDVYFIVSSNTYELCEGMNCFDINENKYYNFNTYLEYKTYIRNAKRLIQEMNENENGGN